MRPAVRPSGPNKISAATFGQIGRTVEEEKYVMGSEEDRAERTDSRFREEKAYRYRTVYRYHYRNLFCVRCTVPVIFYRLR